MIIGAFLVSTLCVSTHSHPTNTFIQFVTSSNVEGVDERPIPQFLEIVDPAARSEFLALRSNDSLSKREFSEAIDEWAKRQGDDVIKAIHEFRQKLTSRRVEFTKRINNLVTSLPPFFERVENIWMTETVSRAELRQNVDSLFLSADVDVANVAKFIMNMNRPILNGKTFKRSVGSADDVTGVVDDVTVGTDAAVDEAKSEEKEQEKNKSKDSNSSEERIGSSVEESSNENSTSVTDVDAPEEAKSPKFSNGRRFF